MKILFLTAHPSLPEIHGGAQKSSHALMKQLQERGHDVSMLCGLIGKDMRGLRMRLSMKLSRSGFFMDTYNGCPVCRAWYPWEKVREVADKYIPDICVVLAGQPVKMARAAQMAGYPVLMMLQNVEFDDHGGDFRALGPVPCVANSGFTAREYRVRYDVESDVIHPIMDYTGYKIQTDRSHVTFINPHPVKGLEIALKLAGACPEIPFLFVKGWPLSGRESQALRARLRDLKNVTLLEQQKDMRRVYAKTGILLAPSLWEEAFGRVVAETQINGIPVLASDKGGLPEAVGAGGITLNPDMPVEEWIKTLRAMWQDETLYERLGKAAFQHALRPALDIKVQYDNWEKKLLNAASVGQMAPRAGFEPATK